MSDIQVPSMHMQYRTVDKLYHYPDDGPYLQDVTLVKLSKAVALNSYTNTICLPHIDDVSMFDGCNKCSTCGFGAQTSKMFLVSILCDLSIADQNPYRNPI